MFGGLISYVWGLQILTFWRNKSLRLGVSSPYVWGFDFLRLGVTNLYVRGLNFFTFWGYKSLRMGVRFLTFGG